jgi:hypothetical protein
MGFFCGFNASFLTRSALLAYYVLYTSATSFDKHDLAEIYHGGRVAPDEEMPSDDEDEEDDGLTQVQRKVSILSIEVQTHPGP